MFKKLLFGILFIGGTALTGHSGGVNFNGGVIVSRALHHSNGFMNYVVYRLYDYYGGNYLGSVSLQTLGTPSATNNLQNYADLRTAMYELDNIFNNYGRVGDVYNVQVGVSNNYIVINTKHIFGIESRK